MNGQLNELEKIGQSLTTRETRSLLAVAYWMQFKRRGLEKPHGYNWARYLVLLVMGACELYRLRLYMTLHGTRSA